MAEVTQASMDALARRLDEVESYLRIDQKRDLVARLERQVSSTDFWSDAEAASKVMSELTQAKDEISQLVLAREQLDDAQAAYDLGREAGEEDVLAEADELIAELEGRLSDLELASWFTGEFDGGDAIVTITPGQGGLEAQDWCGMLFRMYQAYCARRGWKVTVNDAPAAEVIGLDRATFTVSGKNAFGMLRGEQGVHRLVRISPTDAKRRRQTTFAGVEVLPVLPDDVQVDIDPADLRIDVYHASGHGGQGVNTTDSAVRITHLPTGTVVTCQNERSQLQNKAFAMNILRSRLFELELAKREAELDELRGPKHQIGFGNQIRSYVLYPYQLVKDLRSGVETGNVDSVLVDGDLDRFVVGYHRWAVGGGHDA
ncbi:peptide chain release factor 2 [Olsenella sp. HMSC062G07]|uniref:peptide chain release factor 2 n=1 Tax=Olsenella sp. HMSC062G07 TaxID=1739330 RepID=UPI0008A4D6C9|nr:peptide chain release factor 2 [Olsenella sp. HMSC062G07]OFK24964.1 peptide chain release factor 2 [Olsenella sp. HMSC062G07]